jgi:hypothetical protein
VKSYANSRAGWEGADQSADLLLWMQQQKRKVRCVPEIYATCQHMILPRHASALQSESSCLLDLGWLYRAICKCLGVRCEALRLKWARAIIDIPMAIELPPTEVVRAAYVRLQKECNDRAYFETSETNMQSVCYCTHNTREVHTNL